MVTLHRIVGDPNACRGTSPHGDWKFDTWEEANAARLRDMQKTGLPDQAYEIEWGENDGD
jgi:hypothetical protein